MQPEGTQPTIRELVIGWMLDHPGRFTVDQVARDVGLSRRQALNALHGLIRSSLVDMLTRHGAGLWEYSPPDTVRLEAWQDSKYDDGTRVRPAYRPIVPLGWRGEIRLVAKIGRHVLAEAIVAEQSTSIYVWMETLDGQVEWLPEVQAADRESELR